MLEWLVELRTLADFELKLFLKIETEVILVMTKGPRGRETLDLAR